MKLRLLAAVMCLCAVLGLAPWAFAAETDAADITAGTVFSGTGYDSFDFLKDKDNATYRRGAQDTVIRLDNEAGMHGLYLMFDLEFGEYTIRDENTDAAVTVGEYGFLHEYVDLVAAFGYAPTNLVLEFTGGRVRLSEIYVFSQGQTPDFVQKWAPPLDGGADILLFATHGDDDQLYFAGLLPLYAGEKGLGVQVAYMTNHRNKTSVRCHEMLNGLWSVGVDVYPVFGTFDDFRIDNMKGTYNTYRQKGVTEEELLGFVVEQLRRFKPLVAVGHDIKGEYGHGMHKVYADLLMKAVAVSADETAYPELAEKYGVWDVPKTYLHMYAENPIVIDYDQPTVRFGGLTPFQVTQRYGFPCHETQQYDGFVRWLYGNSGNITKATQIQKYNPAEFGLYRSTVGADVLKNDFMENVVSYGEQARLEEERSLEEIRKQEEAKRLEEERRQEEARLEAARKEEEERLAREQEQWKAYYALEEQVRQVQAQQQIIAQKISIYAALAAISLMGLILTVILKCVFEKN